MIYQYPQEDYYSGYEINEAQLQEPPVGSSSVGPDESEVGLEQDQGTSEINGNGHGNCWLWIIHRQQQ